MRSLNSFVMVSRYETSAKQFSKSVRVLLYLNQSAEGAGGLGIIRGNKVGESE